MADKVFHTTSQRPATLFSTNGSTRVEKLGRVVDSCGVDGKFLSFLQLTSFIHEPSEEDVSFSTKYPVYEVLVTCFYS